MKNGLGIRIQPRVGKDQVDKTIVTLKKWELKHRESFRPSWVDYFIAMAFIARTRSHDAETQHGCVITDSNHRVLGVGYNGFPRACDPMVESCLPNIRPEKYPWMLHSEHNACVNCSLTPYKGIAHVTGWPCNGCVMTMWQHGVETVHALGTQESAKWQNESEEEIRLTFLAATGMEINYYHIDALPLTKLVRDLLDENIDMLNASVNLLPIGLPDPS